MMEMINKKRNKKGFTLIELVVVIAILGILAAIAIPRFSNVQDNAKIKADHATAAEIISVARLIDADQNLTAGGAKDKSFPVAGTGGDWKVDDTTYMNVPKFTQSAPAVGFTLNYNEDGKYVVSGFSGDEYVEK